MAVVWDIGAATPVEIVAAARGVCDVTFVVDASSGTARLAGELIAELAPVIVQPADRCAAVARELSRAGVESIVTFSELALGWTAAIAREARLDFHEQATLDVLTDKASQRRRLAEAGLPSTPFATIDDRHDMDGALAAVALPAVLKPRRGAASRDTYLVEDAGVLRALLADRGAAATSWVLEGRLDGDAAVAGSGWGDYVSVEGCCVDGVARSLAVTGKYPLAEPFRETGMVFPSTLAPVDRAAATEVAEAAVSALGIRSGMTHTELKLTASGPRIIEVNGRLGGYVADVVRRSTGVDLVAEALSAAAGSLDAPVAPHGERVAFQRFIAPPAWARRFEGFERSPQDVRRLVAGIAAVTAEARSGQTLDTRAGTGSYVARVMGSAANHEQALAVTAEAESLLAARYSD